MEDDPIREVERENAAAEDRRNEREDDEDYDPEPDERCASCKHKKVNHFKEAFHCTIGDCPCEVYDTGARSKCCNAQIVGMGSCEHCGAPATPKVQNNKN